MIGALRLQRPYHALIGTQLLSVLLTFLGRVYGMLHLLNVRNLSVHKRDFQILIDIQLLGPQVDDLVRLT
jgi:hypothetical protein